MSILGYLKNGAVSAEIEMTTNVAFKGKIDVWRFVLFFLNK